MVKLSAVINLESGVIRGEMRFARQSINASKVLYCNIKAFNTTQALKLSRLLTDLIASKAASVSNGPHIVAIILYGNEP